MRHLPVEPPQFFPRGPSPLARLAFFGLVSLALLFVDTRYHYLEGLRHEETGSRDKTVLQVTSILLVIAALGGLVLVWG